MFKAKFEEAGITIESKQNPAGLVRLVRRIGSACAIIAPEIERLFAEGKINYGLSSIMRWYTNNTKVSTDKYGNKMYGKIEPKLRKNDGFMAFVAAIIRNGWQPTYRKEVGSVWIVSVFLSVT